LLIFENFWGKNRSDIFEMPEARVDLGLILRSAASTMEMQLSPLRQESLLFDQIGKTRKLDS
jgi:hypothetical protein